MVFVVSAQSTCVTPDGLPQDQIVSSDITGKVKVMWMDYSTNEDGFRIKRYDPNQVTWTTVKEIPSTSISSKYTHYEAYDDTLVCDGNPTNYTVAAYRTSGGI